MIRWLTGRWCPPYCIIENAPGKRLVDLCKPDGPGVYRLVALDATGVAAPLERVCGIDPTGTLYIGHSRGLLLPCLRSSVLTHGPGHGFGRHRDMPAKL